MPQLKASFANALTLSQHPVLPGELFLLEIEQTEPGWTGHMRLGLTQLDPTSQLPLYSLPDLSNREDSWICAITKHHNRLSIRDAGSNNHLSRRRCLAGGELDAMQDVEYTNGEEGYDEQHHEYVSCLTRLSVGDHHIRTSRGLVPRSVLLPSCFSNSAEGFSGQLPLATDEGSRIGLIYLPQGGDYAEMHYIINGEDQGIFTRLLPYKDAPLYAIVDVYGTTKRVRIIQLYETMSLKMACRSVILQRLVPEDIPLLPLPPQLLQYLLSYDA
ncbi:hypothetical protein HAZT_HAZT001627 [Hyalella azteca]|uniref:SOCS box domain-containing protein n=1 Tax=Hyalella azteca TaxID=294128 RepID=A0A6A0GU46_HYAAZ|nr:hypothetical protein HAZT_HAZT001627 [Hyalella azteca]